METITARQLGVKRRTRRPDVSKATWRALHEIAKAWVHSEQYARCHDLVGTYGAQHGRLCSWWRFDGLDPHGSAWLDQNLPT